MPSHKEILQSRVADAERDFRSASDEEARLRGEIAKVKQQQSDLQQRYEKACLAAARDAMGEDPASLLAEHDRLHHRRRGLETLHSAALDAYHAAATKQTDAQAALQSVLDQEEMARLKATHADAKLALAAANDAVTSRAADLNRAAMAMNKFKHQLELVAKARA